MMKILKNLRNRFDTIWLLLTSDWYVLIIDRPEPAAPTGIKRTVATNVTDINMVMFVLENSANQMKEAQNSVDTLANEMGIKLPDQ